MMRSGWLQLLRICISMLLRVPRGALRPSSACLMASCRQHRPLSMAVSSEEQSCYHAQHLVPALFVPMMLLLYVGLQCATMPQVGELPQLRLTMKLRSHSCSLIFFCSLVMSAYSRISCLAGRLSSTSDLMRRSRKGFSSLCSLLTCNVKWGDHQSPVQVVYPGAVTTAS